jgi:(p)ppGpp synthase/HD superfamily hydrolase
MDTTAPILTDRFEEALLYALHLHASQMRKASDIPYVVHLLSVAALVVENGGDEDEAIAALLHDAIEDQGGAVTREEIRSRFGERVVRIVDACTDCETTPKPPWRERKERHIEHLRSAPLDVLRVVAADKIHNTRSLLADYSRHGEGLWNRFNGGKEGTLWYYHTMADIVRPSLPCSMSEELDRTLAELDRRVWPPPGAPPASEPDLPL